MRWSHTTLGPQGLVCLVALPGRPEPHVVTPQQCDDGLAQEWRAEFGAFLPLLWTVRGAAGSSVGQWTAQAG